MVFEEYMMERDGFSGCYAAPDDADKNTKAVIVMSCEERGGFSGRMAAERFAEYGFAALAVNLSGVKGMPETPDRIPLEIFAPVIRILKEGKGFTSISTYGVSTGSVFAALAARYYPGMEKVILVSPTHVVPGCASKKKKKDAGHSMATMDGEELPFVPVDFSARKPEKTYKDEDTGREGLGMWFSYSDAYDARENVEKAYLRLEETGADILLLASMQDEMWPADYSIKYMKRRLERSDYDKDVRVVLYEKGSHLLGVMPNRKKYPQIYRKIPSLSKVFRNLKESRAESFVALRRSEKEVIRFLKGREETEEK